jgi:hypothetical protein
MRGLNTKQRQAVNFNRKWCKDAVIAMKKGETIKPYRVFLSGPGGVGKSRSCNGNGRHNYYHLNTGSWNGLGIGNNK